MTSRTAPLYFSDQPTKHTRIKATRSKLLYFGVANEGALREDKMQSSPENNITEAESDVLPWRLSPETRKVQRSLNAPHHNLLEAYRRAAPHLLHELFQLLSHLKGAEERRTPPGVVNILNYTWDELTVGAVTVTEPEQTDKRGKFRGTPEPEEVQTRQVSVKDQREAAGRDCSGVGGSGVSVWKPAGRLNPQMKKCKRQPKRAHSCLTFSFSFPPSSTKNPGWTVLPERPSCDEPQQIRLCRWVVERLQAARDPEKLQGSDPDHNLPLLLRHYGDQKASTKDRRARRISQPAAREDGMLQLPERHQQDQARPKLHYRINNGSSIIYYPSGCIAVCQSCSGLPCGGFYTNVFSDSKHPVVLATVTAFGHGTVTDAFSSAVTAVWDQDGGFTCDHYGNVTKQWSWQEYRTLREKMIIKVSDLISVRLLSSTSAVLCFRCCGESVQLPLSAPCHAKHLKDMPCLKNKGRFKSDLSQEILEGRETKCTAVVLESKTNKMLTPMVREVAEVEQSSAQWRRRGHVGRELKRLQQRIHTIVNDWLDYYRLAVGIKCPGVERMPDAPLRTRLKREVQSAALPSLNPRKQADAKVAGMSSRNELEEVHRHLSAPSQRPADTCVKLPRSVIIPSSPDLRSSDDPSHPAPPSFILLGPLRLCPALLRAALRGEGARRRCCCSTTLMPMLTDLEFDAFIQGQPPHSQQILVVYVTGPNQHVTTPDQDVMEQLYRQRNSHRTSPCTQSQMDSFRLLRYEMSALKPSCGEENILLQQRHNAAPGMVQMYIQGKLLFVGYIFSGQSCSVRDLENQISRSRGDYRLGLSLPPDYKFSETVNVSAATDKHNSDDITLKGGDDLIQTASVQKEKVRGRKSNQILQVPGQRQRDVCIQPKKTSALPHVPVFTP